MHNFSEIRSHGAQPEGEGLRHSIALKTHFPASRGFLASLHASLVGGTKRRETTQVRDARNPFNRSEMQLETD